MFANSTILVTGGTGSFGNIVTKYMLNQAQAKEIRVFSRDEKKQEDMRLELKDPRVKFYIGDVRDPRSLDSAMRGVDYVFSAAALKQVPSCEFYPLEAVNTNVIGSENVLNAAIHNGVKKVIVLSTDKAVYPVNAMGMSKALMEKIAVAKSRTIGADQLTICATRYGNVMASRGSVIPLFIKQIKENKPLTITDPTMTRFLMSLDEAMHLVFFAFKHAKTGDIFVQKAPASTVLDLGIALKDIFNSKSEIQIIGTRHGEKKHETLMNREERSRAIDLGNYYQIPNDDRDLNYNLYFTDGAVKVDEAHDYTSENTERLSVASLKNLLIEQPYVRQQLNEIL